MTGDLISKKTRNEFREYLVASHTLREIEMAFDGADINCDTNHDPSVPGQRRHLIEQYYHSIDFTKWADVRKVLRAYEGLLSGLEQRSASGAIWAEDARKHLSSLKHWLEKDSYTYNQGHITRNTGDVHLVDVGHVVSKLDAPELQKQIERMRIAAQDDPALAIGTAKELVETTCKTILDDHGTQCDPDWDLPRLVKEAREALGLLPEQIGDQARGIEVIRKLLGNLGALAHTLAELRNLYGTGHGKLGKTKSLEPRHSRLAVGAAATLATFLLETHQVRRKPDNVVT